MRRRIFVAAAGLGAIAPGLARALPFADRNPFPFGVASGDPTASAVVLWTRLARDASDPAPLHRGPIAVQWCLAEDERLSRRVLQGNTLALPEDGHSVHVDVAGLQPDRVYWYAFRVGGLQSPVARTRTLPAPTARLRRLRFNLASCQHWENGYFDAYDGMDGDDPAFVLHLGDYIYDEGRGGVRSHGSNAELLTLADFRRRHALYKTDPALQRAHRRLPFLYTLDNHDALPEDSHDPARLARRAAAYQAWYEFQPVRHRPRGARMTIARQLDFGGLMQLSIPDTRQFRDPEQVEGVVSDPAFAFGVYKRPGVGTGRTLRSILGAQQEAALIQRLGTSPARWNLIASSVMMSPLALRHQGEEYRYLQAWDGYPAARERLLHALHAAGTRNPVSLSGDLHANLFSTIASASEPDTPVMTEFVGTSISSLWPQPLDQPIRDALALNPHVRHYRSQDRGYLRITLEPDLCRVDPRRINFTDRPGGNVSCAAGFVVEDRRVAIEPA